MRPFQLTPGDEQDRLNYNFFYRDGTPETARALLRKFLCDDRPQLDADLAAEDPARREAAAAQLFQRTLFFVRAASRRRELVRVYESVLLELDRAERRHIFPILMQVGDETTWALLREQAQKHGVDASNAYYGPDPRFERIARAPISDPAHLDLRWTAFMATGNTRPVVEIMACLAGPDRLRAHLEPLLRPVGGLVSLFTGQRGRQKKLIEGLGQLGIRLHGQTYAIVNADDLDTFVVDGSERAGARLKLLFDALPEPPPAELTREVMVKASAQWSLALNAAEHAPVLAVCEEGAARLDGNGRLNLLAVLAEAHERRGDLAAAQAALRTWIALNPGREEELRGRIDRLALAQASPAIARPGEAK